MSDDHSESSQEIKMIEPPELKGMDWDNDDLFFTHSYTDETSQFDPQGRWNFGCECYERTYYCRIPKAFQDCEEMIERFLEIMLDNYSHIEGFWRDA